MGEDSLLRAGPGPSGARRRCASGDAVGRTGVTGLRSKPRDGVPGATTEDRVGPVAAGWCGGGARVFVVVGRDRAARVGRRGRPGDQRRRPEPLDERPVARRRPPWPRTSAAGGGGPPAAAGRAGEWWSCLCIFRCSVSSMIRCVSSATCASGEPVSVVCTPYSARISFFCSVVSATSVLLLGVRGSCPSGRRARRPSVPCACVGEPGSPAASPHRRPVPRVRPPRTAAGSTTSLPGGPTAPSPPVSPPGRAPPPTSGNSVHDPVRHPARDEHDLRRRPGRSPVPGEAGRDGRPGAAGRGPR